MTDFDERKTSADSAAKRPAAERFSARVGDVTDSTVVIGNDNDVRGNSAGRQETVASEGSAISYGDGPAAGGQSAVATGQSAAAAENSAAAVGQRPAKTGLAEQARQSVLAKTAGAIALVAAIAATALLIPGITNLAVAGYVISLISVLVAVIPLFTNR
jgi:magnesium-transporting ATPase (P-type)